MVTVYRHTNIAEREQRSGITVVVLSSLIHHRDVNTCLLQRLDIAQRQQQLLTGVARRIEVKASGIHQFRHFQQIVRFPVSQRIAVFPLADKRTERLRLHAEEVHIYAINVKGHHRQPFNHFSRQQRAATGKPYAWLDVASGNVFFIINSERRFIQRQQITLNGNDQFPVRFQMA